MWDHQSNQLENFNLSERPRETIKVHLYAKSTVQIRHSSRYLKQKQFWTISFLLAWNIRWSEKAKASVIWVIALIFFHCCMYLWHLHVQESKTIPCTINWNKKVEKSIYSKFFSLLFVLEFKSTRYHFTIIAYHCNSAPLFQHTPK